MSGHDRGRLTEEQIAAFHRDGVLTVPGFYDVKTEIEPIQSDIRRIIEIIADKYGVPVERPESAARFDVGYAALIARDRKFGSEVYDAIKKIPAFQRLIASPRHDTVFRQLRQTDLPGVCGLGNGIRIDNPREERYRAPWHQDYPGQFSSLDGVVFWSPLVPILPSMGPVEFCLGSHRDGLVRVHTHDPKNPDKTGAYALILENDETRVARYPQAAPATEPGDLVLIDFLTIHRSGANVSDRSRWSMQFRYFNFRDATGIRIGWRGSFASGIALEAVHPELVVK